MFPGIDSIREQASRDIRQVEAFKTSTTKESLMELKQVLKENLQAVKDPGAEEWRAKAAIAIVDSIEDDNILRFKENFIDKLKELETEKPSILKSMLNLMKDNQPQVLMHIRQALYSSTKLFEEWEKTQKDCAKLEREIESAIKDAKKEELVTLEFQEKIRLMANSGIQALSRSSTKPKSKVPAEEKVLDTATKQDKGAASTKKGVTSEKVEKTVLAIGDIVNGTEYSHPLHTPSPKQEDMTANLRQRKSLPASHPYPT